MRGLATAFSTLREHMSARTRVVIWIFSILATASKLLVVAVAFAVADANTALAVALGVVGAGVVVFERVIGASARIDVECDLHRAVGRVLVSGDVLAVETFDVRRAVYDSGHHAEALVSRITPVLVADIIVALLLLPVISSTSHPRLVLLAATTLAAVAVIAFALRRFTARPQEKAVKERMKLGDTLSFAVEGRLELVAHGLEDTYLTRLSTEVVAYAKVMRRAAFGSALLGRLPIAVGLVAFCVVVALDTSTRNLASQAASGLVALACIPPFLGVVLGVHGLLQGLTNASPFVELLATPRRADLTQRGQITASVPATISAVELSFAYSPSDASCLRDVSFEWQPKTVLVITGENGSGKSTLLRLLLGLRAPTAGQLRVGGHPFNDVDLPAFRKQVAYLPQRPFLGEPHTSVADLLGAHQHAMGEEDVALARVGLSDQRTQRIGELSGGQRQRLAIARLLLDCERASVILLDEPDANVDSAGVALIIATVEELVSKGKMVAIAAHTRELAQLSPTPLHLTNASQLGRTKLA